jgi:hypothetical protein
MVPLFVAATVSAAPRFSRGQIIGGLGGCIAALPVGSELYARLPPPWKKSSLPQLSIESGRESLVLVLHGAGGPDANTKRIADALKSSDRQVVEYKYQEFVGDQLQGPFNAMRVGDHLADEVLRSPSAPRRVHVVGVSVGAFAADRVASRLADAGKEVRLTTLDPFTARGLFGLIRPDSAYGVNTFGRKATVAENVFNTDDPVPSTNLPLRHAVNFDITDAAEKKSFVPLPGDSLHSWPAAWFGKHPKSLGDERGATLARGSVVSIP